MCRLRWTPWSMLCVLLVVHVGIAQEVKYLVPLPAGLADPMGRTGVLANATGGLDVVDLATGELLWETKEAQRPVLILGQRLYAQSAVGKNGLRLLAFDLAEQGPCVLSSEPVTFPEWVNIEGTVGRSFSARWQLDRNRLVLTWEAAAWADSPPALFRLLARRAGSGTQGNVAVLTGRVDKLEPPLSRQQAGGKAAFDLETGAVVKLAGEPERPVVPRQPPHDAAKLVLRWQGEVAGNFAALTLDAGPDQSALVLRVWNTVSGKQAPARELFRGRHPVAMPTIDGRLLCLRDVTPSPNKLGAAKVRSASHDWSVFAPETGNLVARLPFEPGTQGVAVVGPRAYLLVAGPIRGSIDHPFTRPQVLKAVEIKTGRVLWERAVENRGCVPPGS